MLNILVPVLDLLLVALGIRVLIALARGRLRAPMEPPPAEARTRVSRFGANSNSFMTLYSGFRQFPDQNGEGAIAYIDTPQAWVGGAEPLAPEERQIPLLREFAEAAAKARKSAILLPVSRAFAERARELGFGSLQIGCEPRFVFSRYPRTGRTWLGVVPTAKQFHGKGGLVHEFRPEKLSDQAREELDAITREWLGTRKTVALGFLNQVDPWWLAEDKRYFRVELAGRTLAYVAAVPIPARKSWYLVDLIRRSDSPPGATELLLLQAMRQLAQSGAAEATLGVAPLAGLSSELVDHPVLYRIFSFLFERGNWAYNFKSLFLYKLKFEPTIQEPAFLIYNQPALGLREARGILKAFLPSGLLVAALSATFRSLLRLRPASWIREWVAPEVVVRSVPPNIARLIWRCRLTLVLIAVNLVAYMLTTDSRGNLNPGIETAWGYSWAAFRANPIRSLTLSPFLHDHATHLNLNLLTFVIFTGMLEYLAGSGLTLLCYLTGMWLANPLTSLLFGSIIDPAQTDVGASLGIFACAGGIAPLLKRPYALLALLCGLTAISAWHLGNWLALDHAVAALMGALVCRLWLRN